MRGVEEEIEEEIEMETSAEAQEYEAERTHFMLTALS